jgi:hypothetical protein
VGQFSVDGNILMRLWAKPLWPISLRQTTRRWQSCDARSLFRQLLISSGDPLQNALDEFRVFYNHVKRHQNLNGLTPAEPFAGLKQADIRQMPVKEETPVQAFSGLMRGYWIRR